MKSFSDDLPNAAKTVSREEFEALKADLKKSHLWLAVSIGASMVFTIAAIVVALFIHH